MTGQEDVPWQWQVDDETGTQPGPEADAGAGGASPSEAVTIDWWSLSDADRVAELDGLRLFVGRLVATYGWDERTVPACWEQHEPAVRLLDALRRAYAAALLPGQGGDVMVSWHRSLAFVRDELREHFGPGPCRAGVHDEATARAALQPWAVDISEHGREAAAWQEGQARAVGDYQRRVADAW